MSQSFTRMRMIQRRYGLTDPQRCTVLGGLSVRTYRNMATRNTVGMTESAVSLLEFIDSTGGMPELLRERLGGDFASGVRNV